MNKLVIILLLFLNSGIVASQESIMSILDSLSITSKIVNTEVKDVSSCYSDLLKRKLSFHLGKQSLIYIKDYKQFSIYSILPSNTVFTDSSLSGNEVEPEEHFIATIPKLALLVDNSSSEYYLLKYYQSECSYHKYLYSPTMLLSSNYSRNINKIYKLDNKLLPLSAIEISSDLYRVNSSRVVGDICLRIAYFNSNNAISQKNISKWTGMKNIDEIMIGDLINLLSISKSEIDQSVFKEGEFDLDNLFRPNEIF